MRNASPSNNGRFGFFFYMMVDLTTMHLASTQIYLQLLKKCEADERRATGPFISSSGL